MEPEPDQPTEDGKNYRPRVLIYDDKPDVAKDVKSMLDDDFEMYAASPDTLASELRETIDVIATDVEIIQEGHAERKGYDDVESVMKKACMARPVIVYSNIPGMDAKAAATSKGQGDFFFGYVNRHGNIDWMDDLADLVRKAYASRFEQRSKMFAHWCKEKDMLDKKVSEDTAQKLMAAQETQPEDFENIKEVTYGTVVGWLAECKGEVPSAGPPADPKEADEYEEILFAALKDKPDFL